MESQTKLAELTEVLAKSPSIHEDNRYPILIVREAAEELGLEWRVGLNPEKHLEIGDQGLRLSKKDCELILKSAKLNALIRSRDARKEADEKAKAIWTVGRYLDKHGISWSKEYRRGYGIAARRREGSWLFAEGAQCRNLAYRIDAGDFASADQVLNNLPTGRPPEDWPVPRKPTPIQR